MTTKIWTHGDGCECGQNCSQEESKTSPYLVFDNGGDDFADFTLPDPGMNITLEDQRGNLYSLTNITKE